MAQSTNEGAPSFGPAARSAAVPDAAPVSGGGAGGRAAPRPAELQAWADELAMRHFGRPFGAQVRWAPRLRYRAGDYTPSTGVIRLSLPYFRRYGPVETRRILLHELCHWWLYRQGIRHRENAQVFSDLLQAHGAPARARPMPRARPARLLTYACPVCGTRYRYRRRVDYACGRCCRQWAGGRYDGRFRLVLTSTRRLRPPRRPRPRTAAAH